MPKILVSQECKVFFETPCRYWDSAITVEDFWLTGQTSKMEKGKGGGERRGGRGRAGGSGRNGEDRNQGWRRKWDWNRGGDGGNRGGDVRLKRRRQ